MEGFRIKIFVNMKRIFIIAALAAATVACTKSEIPTYDMKDCAVHFMTSSNSFSMKGVTEDEVEFRIPVVLTGQTAGYDRPIAIEVEDGTAVQGRDYEIVKSSVDAGALEGSVVIRVKKFKDGVQSLSTRFSIVANEHFRLGFPANLSSSVTWSELYTRPEGYVWNAWYLFFCKGYSQDFHKFVVETLGMEVEKYTSSTAGPKRDPSLTFKAPDYWYSANRQLWEAVEAYDKAHPDAPLRHSDDYMYYRTVNIAVGEGEKPASVPTIKETMIIF